MPRFPPVEGTIVGTCRVPIVWPPHRPHILAQITAGDVEVTIKTMASRRIEVTLAHRLGARSVIETCPVQFDNEEDPSKIYWKIAITWKSSDISIAAGGHILAKSTVQLLDCEDKTILLKSEAEILENEKNQILGRGAIRGSGRISPVPAEFESAKQEVERAARCKDILESNGNLLDISDAWKSFLDAFAKTQNKIRHAANLLSQNKIESNSWCGTFDARRKSSKLLTYVFHARNSDTHNIAAILSQKEGIVAITSAGSTLIKNISAINGEMIIEFLGTPPSIYVTPHQVRAVAVTDSGVLYEPPDEAIGLYQLAQGAIVFLEEWLEDAARKFG